MAEIDDKLTDLEATYAARLGVWQDEAIERIARKVAFEGANVVKSGLNLYGSIPSLAADLLTVRQEIASFGADQVRDELARQGV